MKTIDAHAARSGAIELWGKVFSPEGVAAPVEGARMLASLSVDEAVALQARLAAAVAKALRSEPPRRTKGPAS